MSLKILVNEESNSTSNKKLNDEVFFSLRPLFAVPGGKYV